MERCGFHHWIELVKVSRCIPLGRHNSPFDSKPSKRTPFSAISLIVCVCMHQTGPSHGSKRLEGMEWCCFYHSMKVSHWSNSGALTPPLDFTPPRKPHVHPYPPDGFIPQAGAFAPVWGCGRVGRAMGWQPVSPGFDSRRGQFFFWAPTFEVT